MANIEFLEPKNVIGAVDAGTPRTSLDFVIRQNGVELDSKHIFIQSFSGHENMSQLFEYHVSFHANDELNMTGVDLDFTNIVGCSATVRIGLPLDTAPTNYPEASEVCFFNGIVSDISMSESGVYQCTLRPSLWRLTLVNDYHHFSHMTIKEVIEQIVKNKWGLECDTSGLGALATYRTQDWMQMGESDWDYIQGLLNQVGGYFYFTHSDTGHKVIFGNAANQSVKYQNLPPAGTQDTSKPLPIFYTFSTQQTLDEDDYLKSFTYEQKLVAPKCRTILAEPQAAWEENKTAQLHTYVEGGTDKNQFNRYRLFQFGSNSRLASALNKEDKWSLESSAFRLSGECTSPKFKPGHIFEARQSKLEANRNDVSLMRPELDKQRFVILSVRHQAGVDGSYANQFTAAPAKANSRELSVNSTHVGSVLAQVVGKDADRADYHHHWMLNKGKPDFQPETKTFYLDDGTPYKAIGVYVRFLGLNAAKEPTWVKLSETQTSIPEIGVTVMVDRSRDDTDVPQISYVFEQKGSKTIMPNGSLENTRVGDDYSTSYGDSRNISFGNKSSIDLDSAIKKIDGEYGSGQFKSASYSKGGSYSYSSADGGQSGVLSKNYSEGKTYNESHGDSHNKSFATETTSLSNIGVSNDVSTLGISNRTSLLGKSFDNSVTGSTSRVSITGSSTDTSVVGSSTSTNIVGDNDSTQITGVSNSLQLGLESNSTSATLLTNNINAVANNLTVSATALEENINLVGVRMRLEAIGADVDIKEVLGIKAKDSAGQIEADLDGLEARIKELKMEM